MLNVDNLEHREKSITIKIILYFPLPEIMLEINVILE